MLWEATCGRMLFYRDNDAATLHAVLNQPVLSPSDVRPGTQREWDALVLKALARDPAERFASAHALSEALEAFAPVGPSELATFLAGLPRTAVDELATPALPQTVEAATQPHARA